jgi:hypothetical protein
LRESLVKEGCQIGSDFVAIEAGYPGHGTSWRVVIMVADGSVEATQEGSFGGVAHFDATR